MEQSSFSATSRRNADKNLRTILLAGVGGSLAFHIAAIAGVTHLWQPTAAANSNPDRQGSRQGRAKASGRKTSLDRQGTRDTRAKTSPSQASADRQSTRPGSAKTSPARQNSISTR